MTPLISILIPVYNAERYLGICLDSVLAQSYKNLEILCMDDGSTDRSPDILNDYAKKDHRIKILHQKNSGVATARNVLLDASTGEYIAFLDADDTLATEAIEIAYFFIEKDNADIVEFNTTRSQDISLQHDLHIDYTEAVTLAYTDMSPFFAKDKKLGGWITIWNKLYRKESITGIYFDEKLSYEEDYWFSLMVLSKIRKKTIIPFCLHYYRQTETSVTAQVNFEKYTESATHRIRLSYEYFLKNGKVPLAYIIPFKKDLVRDAYRMMIQKNLKKNENKWQKKKLFLATATAFAEFVQKRMIDLRYLPFLQRLAAYAALRKNYFLCRLLCYF